MDHAEACRILDKVLESFREQPWNKLRAAVEDGFELRHTHYEEVEGASGVRYQVRVNVYWDDKATGQLRIAGAVDDGGWRASLPLTSSFIVGPNGVSGGE